MSAFDDNSSPERVAELYPILFSSRDFNRFQNLFDSRATLARLECGVPVSVQNLHEAMPEQIAYASENDNFVETWDNVRIQRHGCIALIIADYTLIVDSEVRSGVDILTLGLDNGHWRILHLAYEQIGFRKM